MGPWSTLEKWSQMEVIGTSGTSGTIGTGIGTIGTHQELNW